MDDFILAEILFHLNSVVITLKEIFYVLILKNHPLHSSGAVVLCMHWCEHGLNCMYRRYEVILCLCNRQQACAVTAWDFSAPILSNNSCPCPVSLASLEKELFSCLKQSWSLSADELPFLLCWTQKKTNKNSCFPMNSE